MSLVGSTLINKHGALVPVDPCRWMMGCGMNTQVHGPCRLPALSLLAAALGGKASQQDLQLVNEPTSAARAHPS